MSVKPITVTREVLECTCERCGNVWISESLKVPVRCAKCRDPNWNKPRVRSKRGSKQIVK